MNRRIFITVAAAGSAAMVLRQAHLGRDLGPLRYAWCGAVTPTSGRIVVCTQEPCAQITLVLDTQPQFRNPIRSQAQETTRKQGCVAQFDLHKLAPKTVYYYGVEIVEPHQTQWVPIGRFETFPEGATDFLVAFASCARTGSTANVFQTIAKQRPNLFIHMGDMHYENIGTAATEERRAAYALVHDSHTQAELYHQVPIAYVWDDHDFLGNNTGGQARTPRERQAIADARQVYQECVPHYPLAAGTGNVPIYQAFSLGRVRFILTDLRSEKIPGETMLGDKQKNWFKEEVARAKQDHALIVWVSTVPWIGEANVHADFWSGYADERRELADFFLQQGLAGRVCIISGDAHMLAIDDGRHSDYATAGGMPIPVFQAAALDQRPSEKGGPYTHEPHLDYGQFGLMTVTDTGRTLNVTWQGMSEDNHPVKPIHHKFTINA